MNILIYKLRKPEFGTNYYRAMKVLEFSLYFWNIIIMWGKENEIN